MNKFCTTFNVKCYTILQPVPYIDFPNFRKDEITNACVSDSIEKRFKSIYEVLRKKVFRDKNYKYLSSYDLSPIFKEYSNGIPYVDCGHYSPRASKKIAEKMVNILLEKI